MLASYHSIQLDQCIITSKIVQKQPFTGVLFKRLLEVIQKQPLEVFYKAIILKNFGILTRKHLWWSLCLNKVVGLQTCNLIKMRLQQRRFPVNIEKLLGTPVAKNISKWLLHSLKRSLGQCLCQSLLLTKLQLRKLQTFFLEQLFNRTPLGKFFQNTFFSSAF